MRDRPAPDVRALLARTPGIQHLVVGPDGPVYEYDAGMADLRSSAAMTPATTMMGYSMSKTITAAAVMRLVQERKVGLDVPASDYTGELPYKGRITVRHLLTHTSGIPNPIPLRWVHPAAS